MRKLGLIGGMSWVSTRSYYEQINRIIQRDVDPRASAPMVIESLDFAEIYRLQTPEDWARAAGVLGAAAQRLEAAGAGMIVIGANSMHKVYREVAEQVSIPILHIAECVGEAMAAKGVKRAALVGTRNVMMESFYRRRLVGHGIDLLPPDMAGVEMLDRIIYDDLMQGRATREAERDLRTMFTDMGRQGAEAVILANTELGLVVDVDANVLPVFDCTRIHASRAAAWIMGEG
jgi:aspartate racemase